MARSKRASFRYFEFPIGQGKMMCGICAKPLRDHELRPCPELGMDMIYAEGRQLREELTK